MTVTAQQTFDQMMKEEVAPALRKLGLKGSGQRFELPSNEFWLLIGFQKSQWSDSDDVRFTINLNVASRARWEEARLTRPYLGARPSPNTLYTAPAIAMDDYAWSRRIGDVLPGGADRWWKVTPSSDTRLIADEVVAAIRNYALPAMRDACG